MVREEKLVFSFFITLWNTASKQKIFFSPKSVIFEVQDSETEKKEH